MACKRPTRWHLCAVEVRGSWTPLSLSPRRILHPRGVATVLALAAYDWTSFRFVLGVQLDDTSVAQASKVPGAIGRGSFGTVFQSTLHGKNVALKRLTPKGENELRDVRREIAMLSLFVDEPSLLGCRGYFEHDGETYLVCEFASMGNVPQFVVASRPDESQKLKLALDLAIGLQTLHNRGVVHRDVKPDSCLVCEGGVGRLCDFGSVRPRSSLNTVATVTGTEIYQPLELLTATSNQARWCSMFPDFLSFPP
eukprot:TRINITY_DN19324_c0_g1_i1.p2 TRINITY_DN19324_c0_g1~~TRINITY_DN19324_c0_g1_i1.p2  ORF type:complete len:253 (-),score=25.66 TRINITY_DN19324_c0_g1_i1:342-1100(-)